MTNSNISLFSGIKSNFAPGLVVFLVALPLCLGIAIASGAPPLSGIIAGVIGGIIIGSMSNSHISVSGPAAGLAAIILSAITELGAFELFLCAGIIAGVIQIFLGMIRAGSISNYFPNNVIEGMLAGIGVIIVIKQVPHALGYDMSNMASEKLFEGGSYSIIPYLQSVVSGITPGVIVVAAVSFAILLLWDNMAVLRKIRLLPGALVAVLASILLNELFIQTNSPLAIGPQHLVNLTVISSFSDIGNLITLPDFSGFLNPNVWIAGATIAIVASIETLLCIEAADRMDTHRRITDTNLELRAQGVGNVISSLLGGLPMTSVVVRSSANANAGATSRLSTIIHGSLLLISILVIPALLNKIPLGTLGAVLILIGYKLAKPAKIRHFLQKGRSQFIPFIATLIAVVATDLLKGVGIGLFISVVYILQGNMKRAYYLSREELVEADDIKITLTEEVSFLNKAAIKKTLKNINPNSTVTIDARKSSYIADDVLELIEDFTNIRAKEAGIDVKLYGFKTTYAENEESRHSHVIIKHRRSI